MASIAVVSGSLATWHEDDMSRGSLKARKRQSRYRELQVVAFPLVASQRHTLQGRDARPRHTGPSAQANVQQPLLHTPLFVARHQETICPDHR
jgi:hypothetical protein